MTPRLTFALCLLPACAAAQQALPDPTRPPPGIEAASAASAPMSDGLVLQSVIKGSGRKPAAVINGQIVPLGDRLGEQRVTRITESSVQLSGPQGITLLTLMPEGQKTVRRARTELSK